MKILVTTDKRGSAIDRLARMTAERLKHHDVRVISFHPKRPSPDEIQAVTEAIEWADIWDAQYWKSAVAIRGLIPEANDLPVILTHHNEHNIEGDWEWKKLKWDYHVVKNGWQKGKLEQQGYTPILIKHAIEFDNFKYIEKLTEDKVVGYVGQIKKVKGVKQIYQACHELGYKLFVVGLPSEAEYYDELLKEGTKNGDLIISSNVSDETIGEMYHKMRVYCANSDDGTESGTMPILEAMAAGIPVVTRQLGLVRDCGEHTKNMFIRDGHYQDIEELKSALKMVMENEDIANKLRDNAWRTVRQYHPDIQAREYEKLFYQLLYPEQKRVSVIMPTYNRVDILLQNLINLKDQTYKAFEVIVCDDNSDDGTFEALDEVRKNHLTNYPIRYINTFYDGYGLAKARNLGVVEAIGEVLVFCDDRLKMHPNAIDNFVKKLNSIDEKRVWLWGSKGCFKSFVENFSATWRQAFINGGMFNERIDGYGGTTQEVSKRYGAQQFHFDFVPDAVAEPMIVTHSKSKNRESIIKQKVKLYKIGY